jgi:arylsulfatase A-like enzyme
MPDQSVKYGNLPKMAAMQSSFQSRFGKILTSGIAALLGLFTLHCKIVQESVKPNLVVISLDTVRADHCSFLGYQKPTTPNIERLANKGTIFTQAYSPSSTTGPSHASFFTALWPVTHGVVKNGLPLIAENRTLAEILKENGYQTSAVVSSFVLDSKFGYSQGFDTYADDFDQTSSSIDHATWENFTIEGGFDQRADRATEIAIKWLRESRDPHTPFFLFVHYFDPHFPYDPPEEFADRFLPPQSEPDSVESIIARYDGEIAFTDHQIGFLLNALDESVEEENTLIAVVSDHGEGLGQHGLMQHGVTIYEETVRVPFLLSWPDQIPSKQIIRQPFSLTNLAPTLLDLMGFGSRESQFQGKSYASAIRTGMSSGLSEPVFLFRRHYDDNAIVAQFRPRGIQLGVRLNNWKYIEGESDDVRELFHLSLDPGELNNLFVRDHEEAVKLKKILEQWKQTQHPPAQMNSISDEDLEALKSLGYIQ